MQAWGAGKGQSQQHLTCCPPASRVLSAAENKVEEAADRAKKAGSDIQDWAEEKVWYKR